MARVSRGTALALIACLPLVACAQLPDLSGYGAATAEVQQSVATSGSAVATEIRNAAAVMEGDPQRRMLDSADRFEAAWKINVTAMAAATDYAQSIEAIARSGNQGADSAAQVAAQVGGIASSLGIALGPAAPAAELLVETIGFLNGQVSIIRAKKSLDESLAAAGPSVLKLRALMQRQVADARLAFNSALAEQARSLRESYAGEIGVSNVLRERETRALDSLKAFAGASPPDDAGTAQARAELAAVAGLRGSVAAGLADYEAKRAAITARRTAGNALLDASDVAIATWGAAHARLVVALRTRQPVTLASLDAAVTEIRELTRKWREL